jgi:hypothetical protein
VTEKAVFGAVWESWGSGDFSKASAFIKTIINGVENAKQKDKIYKD